MNATTSLLLAGLLSVGVIGCATPGRSYDDSKISRIEKNVTTEAEMLDWFGPAHTRTLSPEGRKTLSWRFSTGQGLDRKSVGRLEAILGADGKVMAYSASAGAN